MPQQSLSLHPTGRDPGSSPLQPVRLTFEGGTDYPGQQRNCWGCAQGGSRGSSASNLPRTARANERKRASKGHGCRAAGDVRACAPTARIPGLPALLPAHRHGAGRRVDRSVQPSRRKLRGRDLELLGGGIHQQLGEVDSREGARRAPLASQESSPTRLSAARSGRSMVPLRRRLRMPGCRGSARRASRGSRTMVGGRALEERSVAEPRGPSEAQRASRHRAARSPLIDARSTA